MFATSEALRKRIQEISSEIFEASNGIIFFEEYIALPYYGRICLRFNLNLPIFDLNDLDRYEQMIYETVKDEFIIDFMGDVYRKAGVDYARFDETLERMAQRYQDEVIRDLDYAAEVREDAKYLLKRCGMDENLEVWEIQPGDDLILLILGDEPKQIGTYETDGIVIYVMETDKRLCEGLTKAVEYAKQHGVSLVRTILENQNDPS